VVGTWLGRHANGACCGNVTYVGQLDVAVGDAGDLSSGTGHGLDAYTVVGVHDLRVEDLHSVDDVVVTAANGSNRQTVTTRAVAAGESDVGATVDSKAVVLVVDGGAANSNSGRGSYVESIGVVATLGVAVLVVNGEPVELGVGSSVDGEDLDRGVLDGL
jgi:hypothetical protein